ncbi:MAG: SycD/LcrH family type III secretion system chaperone [Parachlamydia sp.]|jgi:type III secretion system low calcium response chaperone LcrH/SycD|nr:SycD/LcrH family type III secretion system chaperone [Parachlamydia sp.]
MKGSRGAKGQMKKEAWDAAFEKNEKFDQAYSEIMNKMFKEGQTPKDAMGVNNNVLESIYAQAYRLYNTGKYIEATHLFRVLIMLNVTEPKYTLGLAACFHMLKEYKNAIQTYTMCSTLDPSSPIPYYHSSDCFIQMKDYLSAMLCLQLAIDKAGEKPEYAKIKERASLSLESIKQQNLPSTPIERDEEEI